MGLLLNPSPLHGSLAPSAWVQRWAHLIPASARVLDLACGSGRHVRFLAARGAQVTAVDRDDAALQGLRGLPGVAEVLVADLEGAAWPLSGRQFDAVVVTNYLWRALLPRLLDSLAPGGVLLYETFASGNETVGKPSRPDFLLRPGELLQAFAALRVVAYEDGFLSAPERFVQRIVAVHQPAATPAPTRWPLAGPAPAGG